MQESHDDVAPETQRISFWRAWLLPNVLFYASAFFFLDMVNKVFFYSLFEFFKEVGLTEH